MSRKTDSPVTAMTVPSSCLRPSAGLRAWACSNCVRRSEKDGSDIRNYDNSGQWSVASGQQEEEVGEAVVPNGLVGDGEVRVGWTGIGDDEEASGADGLRLVAQRR